MLHGTSGGAKNSLFAISCTRSGAVSATVRNPSAPRTLHVPGGPGLARTIASDAIAARLLGVIEYDVLPLTERGVPLHRLQTR